jgi:hypothetical protein
MQKLIPTNVKIGSSLYNNDDDRNDTSYEDEIRSGSIALSFCMNIDWGTDKFKSGVKSPATQETKIRTSQSLLLLPNQKTVDSTQYTTHRSSGSLDRDHGSQQDMLIFRRLSDSLHGVVSRFTCSSSEERENSTSTLRDEDFHWLPDSNSWMSQSTTIENEEAAANTT